MVRVIILDGTCIVTKFIDGAPQWKCIVGCARVNCLDYTDKKKCVVRGPLPELCLLSC